MLVSMIYNIFLPAHPDEAYYWQWSQNLALSYFDGPPLIAYLIKIVTVFFGSNAWSIKLTSILCITTGLYFIYKLSLVLFSEKIAFFAVLIFIFMPICQSGYVVCTLDSALFVFWIMTLYYFYRAVTENCNKYRYLTGLSFGLTLLAKYPAVLLGLSLFLFLVLTPYRKELKNKHWYFSAILAFFVFSPVLFWNWQHGWESFIFQYSHGISEHKHFQWSFLGNFLGSQLGITNPIFFIALIYLIIFHFTKIIKNTKLLFLFIPFATVFFFFGYQALFKFSEANWAAPAYITASILLAYIISTYNMKKLLYSIIVINIILSIFLRFPQTTPFLPKQAILLRQFIGYQTLIKQIPESMIKNQIIISNKYQTAAELSLYLPKQPQVYILNDGGKQHSIWSKNLKNKIKIGEVKSVVYIGEPGNLDQITPFFHHHKQLKVLVYHGEWISRQWLVINAWND